MAEYTEQELSAILRLITDCGDLDAMIESVCALPADMPLRPRLAAGAISAVLAEPGPDTERRTDRYGRLAPLIEIADEDPPHTPSWTRDRRKAVALAELGADALLEQDADTTGDTPEDATGNVAADVELTLLRRLLIYSRALRNGVALGRQFVSAVTAAIPADMTASQSSDGNGDSDEAEDLSARDLASIERLAADESALTRRNRAMAHLKASSLLMEPQAEAAQAPALLSSAVTHAESALALTDADDENCVAAIKGLLEQASDLAGDSSHPEWERINDLLEQVRGCVNSR